MVSKNTEKIQNKESRLFVNISQQIKSRFKNKASAAANIGKSGKKHAFCFQINTFTIIFQNRSYNYGNKKAQVTMPVRKMENVLSVFELR